jgi:hypothetical protein
MTRREELLTLVAAAYQGYIANPNPISFDISLVIKDALEILQKIDEVDPKSFVEQLIDERDEFLSKHKPT